MHANPLIEFMEGFFRQAYDGFCPEEYVVRTQSTYCTRSSSQCVSEAELFNIRDFGMFIRQHQKE